MHNYPAGAYDGGGIIHPQSTLKHLFQHPTTRRLLSLAWLLALFVLPGCSAEKRDRLWQTLDPAGYKHAHMESFRGSKAIRRPESKPAPDTDDMSLDFSQ